MVLRLIRDDPGSRAGAVARALNAAVVAAVLAGVTWWSFRRAGVPVEFATLWPNRQRWLSGLWMTVVLAIGALVCSLLIGVAAAAAARSRILALRYLAGCYVTAIRCTPLLVQIYFFWYIISTAWGMQNRYVAGVVILSLFEGAYICEIIRGAWNSIDGHTYEVARALGLRPRATFRLVTLPVLLSRSVPALAGQFASVIKDSSLLSVVAVIELTQTTQEISAENFQMFANYLFLGLLYFALAYPVTLVAQLLERRLSRAFADQRA